MLGLSKRFFLCTGVAVLIMLSFFIVKTLVMVGWLPCNEYTQWYEYLSVILFMPPFFTAGSELLTNRGQSILRRKALQAILDESCLVSQTDRQGRIIDVNNKFCEVSGYKRQELLGKDHRVLNSGTHPRSMWMDMYEATIKYKTIWHDIVTNRSKGGGLYIVDTYIMATFESDGKHSGFLSVRQDITELMNSLREVDRKNAYLEHAAKILRHDMHSGINTYLPRGIKSLERRLEKLVCDKGQKNIESPMKMLKEGLAHAQKVYNGVKEFTNLVKKDAVMDRQPHDLQQILMNYLKGTSYKSSVVVEDLGTEEVNESLFCTAVDNLIRNGLRYNDSDTKLVKLYREEGVLVVEDNGRGMSQEQFDEFSKPYTRGENNKESGSGLGLNICVAIMTEHGFKVNSEKVKTGTKLKIEMS
jgi:PAS domain S-box-containing protein